MHRSRIGFVVGLKAEAALLRGRGFMVGVGGGSPAGAAVAAEALLAKGAGALISFGLAGGLNPLLRAGAIIVPLGVVNAGNQLSCDAELAALLGGATADLIYAGDLIAETVAGKSALFAATKADAVDLESGAVARVAAGANLPFAVLRAVIDAANCALPPAALIALDHAGTIGFSRLLGSIMSHPGQLPALIRLGRDAGIARRALVNRLDQLTP